jgi:hypothetical protein
MYEPDYPLEVVVTLDENVRYRLYQMFSGLYVLQRWDERLPKGSRVTGGELFRDKNAAENALSEWVSEERKSRGYT